MTDIIPLSADSPLMTSGQAENQAAGGWNSPTMALRYQSHGASANVVESTYTRTVSSRHLRGSRPTPSWRGFFHAGTRKQNLAPAATPSSAQEGKPLQGRRLTSGIGSEPG